MARLAWPLCPLPERRGEAWRFELTTVAQLPATRATIRGRLSEAAPPSTTNDSAESLVLAFDELASNALRHGGTPVVATVVAYPDGWLIDVSDRAANVGPTPAVDRDPAQGGLGLHLVAQLAATHGWCVAAGRKHVWAHLPAVTDDRTPALV